MVGKNGAGFWFFLTVGLPSAMEGKVVFVGFCVRADLACFIRFFNSRVPVMQCIIRGPAAAMTPMGMDYILEYNSPFIHDRRPVWVNGSHPLCTMYLPSTATTANPACTWSRSARTVKRCSYGVHKHPLLRRRGAFGTYHPIQICVWFQSTISYLRPGLALQGGTPSLNHDTI